MWGNARINKKFLDNLARTFGQREFTSMEAQELYIRDHAKVSTWEKINSDFYWPKANARANIAIAAERGILIRVRRGVYKFNK